MAKILLIEDDPDVAVTIRASLQHNGFEVIWASEGAEAFRLIAAGAFDLVISDLFMPGKDGIEVILEMRQVHPEKPVILMTGGGFHFPTGSTYLKNLTDSAELFGAVRTLQKPFRTAELMALLNSVLGCGPDVQGAA